MVLDPPIIDRLLGAIEANRLVLLCGAGLSIPAPSNLMSAVEVSRSCYDKYHAIRVLPMAMRDDIDQLAGHFYGNHEFESVFIDALVPWNDLVGAPNPGHGAVADLLISRAAYATLSSNFDLLIEQAAQLLKVALVGALDGREAVEFTKEANPLIKFHGCLTRRRETLWTQAQLLNPVIAARIDSCSQWMRLQLPGKDLLVIGFWTDWGYLNNVLADALDRGGFNSVTIINRADSADLEAKAPRLWAMLNAGTPNFRHAQGSSTEALEELRIAFSRFWLRRFYALGQPLILDAGLAYVAMDPVMTSVEDYYRCRSDAEGEPYNLAAKKRTPSGDAQQAAFFHHLLVQAGALREGPWYLLHGRRIRVVNGGGHGLNSVRERYKEPPAITQPDIVVCAGAIDLRIPGSVISTGSGLSIIRPGPGAGTVWLTLEQARAELGI